PRRRLGSLPAHRPCPRPRHKPRRGAPPPAGPRVSPLGPAASAQRRNSTPKGAIGRRALTVAAAAVSIAAGAALPASAGAAPAVLVVGDSLTVMAAPYLEQHLPGVRLTVNAENGYNSFQIRDLCEEAFEPSQAVIVFAAGTNDNPAH